jgi:hypothetical protein
MGKMRGGRAPRCPMRGFSFLNPLLTNASLAPRWSETFVRSWEEFDSLGRLWIEA